MIDDPKSKALAAALIALVAAVTADAEPARKRLLDQVTTAPEGACEVVHVSFTFPLRYVRHFPYDGGDELRVQLEPIAVSPLDRPLLAGREAMRPAPDGGLPLYEVIFEGDMDGGPFLTLRFRRPVSFAVAQGGDFRSLLIGVPRVAGMPATACHLDGAK